MSSGKQYSEKANAAFTSDSDDKEEDTRDNEESQTLPSPIAEEDKAKKDALTEELNKIENEMKTLRDVLAAKQKRATEIKKLLGHNIVSDVREKVKTLQDSDVISRTNQAFKTAGEKTSAAFSNIGKRFGDVRSKLGESLGSSLNNVKARVNGSKFDLGNRLRASRPMSGDHSVASPLDEVPGY